MERVNLVPPLALLKLEEKMFRTYIIIFIVHLCFMFQGCATSEHLEGSSREEAKKFKMTKEEMWNEMERPKIKNLKLQRQIGILENCLLYTSPSPRDRQKSRMPSSA